MASRRRPGLPSSLVLAAACGLAALSHELLWARRMSDLLGATPATTARVLGAFFLGFSLGAALTTWRGIVARRPWRALAGAQLGSIVLSAPLVLLASAPAWLWRASTSTNDPGVIGPFVELVFCLVLVGPPALCIGMTLPLLANATLTRERSLGREGIWIYACEMVGAVLGLGATIALLEAGSGSLRAMLAILGVDLALALAALRLDRRASAGDRDAEEIVASPRPPAAAAALGPATLAFASGLGVLAAEVLALHLLRQVVLPTFLGTAGLLASALLPLSLAALASAAMAGRTRGAPLGIPLLLATTALAALATPLLFDWQTGGMRYLELERSASLAAFVARTVGLGLAAFGPFFFVAGLVLPAAFAWYARVGADPRGQGMGVLLASNGLGGLAGAELASRVLLPGFGMHLGFAAVALVYATAAAGTALLAPRPVRRAAALGAPLAFALVLGLPVLRALPRVRLDPWPGAQHRLVDLASGPEGTVAVADFGDDRVILVDNQYVLGGQRSFLRQERMALLPLALHPAPRRVAFVGLGTGITAGGGLVDDTVASVTAIEIAPLVVDMSRRYFASVTQGLFTSPRARVITGDGRLVLSATPRAYDVIVGDLLLPFEAGAGRLYSVEYFRAARAALAPGGELCVWLPMFQLTAEEFQTIVRTFREVFPEAFLFRDDLSAEAPAFALVGYRDGSLDWDAVARRSGQLRESGRTRDGFVAFPRLLHALYLGALRGPNGAGPRNTLDNGWLETQAARDQVGTAPRFLDAGTWDLLPSYLHGLPLEAALHAPQ